MNDKFSLYQTDGLWGIIENTSNEKQTSIKSYFGSDLIVKLLNEQADQIDQLKQQNEELMLQLNRQNVEEHKPVYCTLAGTECEYLGKVEELQQQLAEKDCRIEELEGQFAYECECNKQLVDLQKQLAEKDKEINSLIVDYEKRISQEQELMSNMEHRLAEKQNTIDEINKEFVQAVHDWKALCAKKDEEIEDCKRNELYEENMKILAVKNQTQLAIQELEKVKNFVDGRTYCANYIKKRIKELKGEKDVED